MVTPAAHREAAAYLQSTYQMSQRRAIQVIGADRTSIRYRSTRPDDGPLRDRLKALAAELRPYPGNPRTHSRKQVRQIADSIQRFGFTNPILISECGEIIAGHGRVQAAKLLGMADVPTIRLANLSKEELRAYVLADNKLALNAGWDHELLAIELQGLIDLDFDVALTGFSPTEIDLTLDLARGGDPQRSRMLSSRIALMSRSPGPGWRT